ncbi:MAG: DUF2975 domain-containing protein [Clostridia bacterium]|nr:DUF2975 domain-containing protein [Clostridia bacterium]
MSQKTLSCWLKAVIVVVALVGVWLYGLIVPMVASSIREVEDHLYHPVLIFLLGTGVPCFASLVFAWKIASEIGRDNSFSRINAKCMKIISGLALGDVIYFALGMTLIVLVYREAFLWFFPLCMFSLFLIIAGLAISVCSAALSHLILKAAAIREENDMTI